MCIYILHVFVCRTFQCVYRRHYISCTWVAFTPNSMLRWKRIPVDFQLDPVWYRCSCGCGDFCNQLYRCLKLDLFQHFGCSSHTSAANHMSPWSDTNTTHRITRLDVTQWGNPLAPIVIFQDNLEFTILAFFFRLWEKAWYSQAHPSYPRQLQYCALCGADLRRWLIEEYNQCI